MDGISLPNALLTWLLSLVFLYTIWFIYRQIEFYILNVPPGPIGVPLLGYIPFMSAHPYKDLAYLNKFYGKLCSFIIGPKRCLIVSDYDTAKKLLCHPATLSRPDKFLNFSPGKGGLSGMNGKKWELERRLVMQTLRNVGLGKELWDDIIREDISALTDSIKVVNGEPVDLSQLLHRATLSSMLCLILGRHHGHEFIKAHFETMRKATEISKACLKNFVVVLFPWMESFLTKFNIAGLANLKEITEKLINTMSEKIHEILKGDGNESTNFVQQYAKEIQKQRGCETMDDASVECLLGNISSFIITTDTAALATGWIFYLMASHPEVQAKVHDEIDDAMGRNVIIRWEDRDKLPYTMACILEMERWASVVPVPAPRCASETFQFEEYTIFKGTIILTNIWALNRDPKYWDHPSEYFPERMLKSKIESVSNFGGYAPFSFGRRNCPVERISLMITFFFFTTVMQKFAIRIPPGETVDHEPLYNGTLQPKSPNLCFIERQ